MNRIPRLTKAISMNKLKMQRGYSYISSVAIPFLVAREVGKIFPKIGWGLVFIFAIIIVWFAGHLDWKYFWKNELEFSFSKNPEWVREIKKKEMENE